MRKRAVNSLHSTRLRTLILILLPVAASLAVGAAYASSVSPGTASAVGGTGQVSVSCPSAGCAVQRLSWSVSAASDSQPLISGASILWQPATATGSYQVYVTVYGPSGSVVASGSAAQSGSQSQVTTAISFGTPLQFNSIASVEVDIVQTA